MAKGKLQNKTGTSKAKILIVDDHPILRQGLGQLIDHEDDLVVCGQAESAHQALLAIDRTKPDMAVVDITLKDRSGLELIKDIRAQYPDMAILALSMHDESLYAERALRAGARGYVMKLEATENVVKAIRRVLSGDVYLSDNMAARLVHKLVGHAPDAGASPTDRLSDREMEVFTMIGRGTGTRQIAQKLCLSVKTIETYRAHIKEKLDLEDAEVLLIYAIQWVSSRGEG